MQPYNPDLPLTTNRQPDFHPVSRFVRKTIGRLYLWIMGWRISGHVPDLKQAIVIVYPHTSSRDGWVILASIWYLSINARGMIKIEAIRSIYGFAIQWLGGVGVDRHRGRGTVDQAVEFFKKNSRFVLGMSPEGTRRKVHYWKSGFYQIARKAGVPIVCIALDYKRKVLGISEPLYLSGDVESDLDEIRTFYEGVEGYHPDKATPIKMRPVHTRGDGSDDD